MCVCVCVCVCVCTDRERACREVERRSVCVERSIESEREVVCTESGSVRR